MESEKLYRRLNLLLYLNPVWNDAWGGDFQFWDPEVKQCCHSYAPVLNRAVIFETSEISFHGVTPISSEAPYPRLSFAAYYYTASPPKNWTGDVHSTVFKARPDEKLRGYILMPAEKIKKNLVRNARELKRNVKKFLSHS